MPHKKKSSQGPSPHPPVDNIENDDKFTKIVSADTQPIQESNSFDFENFSDFFHCKSPFVKVPFQVRKDNELQKCSQCYKGCVDLKKCTECKAVSYCDRACQKADWPQHKIICRKLKELEASSVHYSNPNSETAEKDNGIDMKGDFQPSKKSTCTYCSDVKSDLKTCVRCKAVMYCDKLCQKAHWPEHKKTCEKVNSNDGGKALYCTHLEVKGKTAADFPRKKEPKAANGHSSRSAKPLQKKTCAFCERSKSNLVKCPKCNIAVYCDDRCRANHRLEHKDECEHLPKFVGALENASEMLADYHCCTSTEFVLPGELGYPDGVAVMLKIVEPYFHPFRHAVLVQDLKGEKVQMFFYHDKEEEVALLPKKLGSLLTPGNFMRWFYPRWHYFLDGRIGFRIDSLNEVELLQVGTRFTIHPK